MAVLPMIDRAGFREVAEERLVGLAAFWESNAPERAFAEETAKWLEEDQAKWLQANDAETAEHWAKKPKIAVDFSSHILNAVATTYVSPAHRAVAVEGADEIVQDQLDEVNTWLGAKLWDFGLYGLDDTLQDVDRWTMWHGTIACEPRYQRDEQDPDDEGGVETLYYRRHEFEVLPKADDPRMAQAVIFPVRTETVRRADGAEVQQTVFHYWDDQVFAKVIQTETSKGGWQILDMDGDDPRVTDGVLVHGLGYVPIEFMRSRRVQREFYSPGADVKLFGQAQVINKMWTEFAHLLRVHHGYPVVKGKLKGGALAPDAFINVDTDGDFDVKSPGGNPQAVEQGIQRLMDNLGVTFGLAPGALSMDPAVAKSGVAITVEKSETERLRKERIPTWVKFERRLFKTSLDIFRVFSGLLPKDMPFDGVDATLAIVHQDPPTTISKQEVRDNLAYEREHELISKRQMLSELRPELTVDQVRLRLEEADAETKAAAPVNPLSAFIQRPRLGASQAPTPNPPDLRPNQGDQAGGPGETPESALGARRSQTEDENA